MSVRQFALDTETTGLEVDRGHRLVELALVELLDRRLSGRELRWYLNPDRDSDPGALEVHGLTREFLADKPRFADIADEFLSVIDGSELIIHNAAFDVPFIEAELARLGRGAVRLRERATVIDSLLLARELHPGQRNSLDALCRRYDVDNSGRSLHGALLDAQLLAEAYLAMTSGQISLDFGSQPSDSAQPQREWHFDPARLVVWPANEIEVLAHQQRLTGLDKSSRGRCLWLQLDAQAHAISGEGAESVVQ
jgi:DNA polymerase-3 subunit epsilon